MKTTKYKLNFFHYANILLGLKFQKIKNSTTGSVFTVEVVLEKRGSVAGI